MKTLMDLAKIIDGQYKTGIKLKNIKQRIRRFAIDNEIGFKEIVNGIEIYQFDIADEKLILEHFQEVFRKTDNDINDTSQPYINDIVIDTLVKQLEIKDEQIKQLNEALAREQFQHFAVKQELLDEKSRGLFKRLFGIGKK